MRSEVNNNVGCSSSVVECWALNNNVGCSSSVVECWALNRDNPLANVWNLGIFESIHVASFHSAE